MKHLKKFNTGIVPYEDIETNEARFGDKKLKASETSSIIADELRRELNSGTFNDVYKAAKDIKGFEGDERGFEVPYTYGTIDMHPDGDKVMITWTSGGETQDTDVYEISKALKIINTLNESFTHLKKFNENHPGVRYLKTFESHGTNLAEDIAKDILPKLIKIREEKGQFTVGMFDNYMEERNGDMKLTDEVMSYLVSMGFDFDTDVEDDDYEDETPTFNYNLN